MRKDGMRCCRLCIKYSDSFVVAKIDGMKTVVCYQCQVAVENAREPTPDERKGD